MSFSRDAISKTGEFSKTNSCSVELAVSYFTVKWSFKTRIIVFITDILFKVG